MPSLAEILNSKIGSDLIPKTSVAAHLGVSERTIENYMRGTREPGLTALIKLAKFLEFDLNELMQEEQSVPRKKKTIPDSKEKTIADVQKEILAIVDVKLSEVVKILSEVATGKHYTSQKKAAILFHKQVIGNSHQGNAEDRSPSDGDTEHKQNS